MTDADFGEQFSLMRGRLLAICSGLVGSDEAEDIVQETYLRARRNLQTLREVTALEGWATRIAVNLCYSHHARGGRLRRLLPVLLPAQTHQGGDLGLRDLLERLPARERTVTVLHYGHGYAFDEIARLLSISPENARTIASRTRRKLAAEWRRSG